MSKTIEIINLGDAIQFYKSELKKYYPLNELNSIISIVFQHVLKLSSIELHTRLDLPLQKDKTEELIYLANELKKNIPVQYLIGETIFYNTKLLVNEHVLIPRPETEELVNWVVENESVIKSNLTVIDIGTGSGCIAIALTKTLHNISMNALEKSIQAIEIAKKNALINNVAIDFIVADILYIQSNLANKTFDIIVSNPPYVLENEKEEMLPNVLEYEPHEALFVPDQDPLIFYKAILKFSEKNLKKGGRIYLEINEKYGNDCAGLFRENGFADIELKPDINGKQRMLKAIKPA